MQIIKLYGDRNILTPADKLGAGLLARRLGFSRVGKMLHVRPSTLGRWAGIHWQNYAGKCLEGYGWRRLTRCDLSNLAVKPLTYRYSATGGRVLYGAEPLNVTENDVIEGERCGTDSKRMDRMDGKEIAKGELYGRGGYMW